MWLDEAEYAVERALRAEMMYTEHRGRVAAEAERDYVARAARAMKMYTDYRDRVAAEAERKLQAFREQNGDFMARAEREHVGWIKHLGRHYEQTAQRDRRVTASKSADYNPMLVTTYNPMTIWRFPDYRPPASAAPESPPRAPLTVHVVDAPDFESKQGLVKRYKSASRIRYSPVPATSS